MDRKNCFDGFYFQNNFFIDNHVDPVPRAGLTCFIEHGQRDLPFEIYVSHFEFVRQTLLIDILKKSGSEFLVHCKRTIHDLFCNKIDVWTWLGHSTSLYICCFAALLLCVKRSGPLL
jgi:hypothetical protein